VPDDGPLPDFRRYLPTSPQRSPPPPPMWEQFRVVRTSHTYNLGLNLTAAAADHKFAQQCLKHYRESVTGPPNHPTAQCCEDRAGATPPSPPLAFILPLHQPETHATL
jgi:hypothetical protein